MCAVAVVVFQTLLTRQVGRPPYHSSSSPPPADAPLPAAAAVRRRRKRQRERHRRRRRRRGGLVAQHLPGVPPLRRLLRPALVGDRRRSAQEGGAAEGQGRDTPGEGHERGGVRRSRDRHAEEDGGCVRFGAGGAREGEGGDEIDGGGRRGFARRRRLGGTHRAAARPRREGTAGDRRGGEPRLPPGLLVGVLPRRPRQRDRAHQGADERVVARTPVLRTAA
mmetsp:Transcript_29104/g.61779  ORF Transcript_29104/g.61779 Transcript_29104/m.61779 type:complete len:222 (+) Transcript_29104:222-887(+)